MSSVVTPTGWALASAADVCSKIQDGTHFSPKVQLSEGKYRYVTAKNVRPWGLDLSDSTYLRDDDHRGIYARCDTRKGDVLLVKDGVNAGDAALNTLDEEVSLLSSVCFLRPTEILRGAFLRYYLQSPTGSQFLTGRLTGTAIRRIVLERVRELPVVVAPVRQQDLIVEAIDAHFSRLDEIEAWLKRVRRNLKRYRAAVLQAAVEGRLVSTEAALAQAEGRDYEPASDLLKRILAERRRRWEEGELARMKAAGKLPKDDKWKSKYVEPAAPDTANLQSLREGWCWTSADAVGDILLGRRRAPEYRGALRPYFRVANVRDDRIDSRHIRSMPFDDGEFAKYQLRAGDILG